VNNAPSISPNEATNIEPLGFCILVDERDNNKSSVFSEASFPATQIKFHLEARNINEIILATFFPNPPKLCP
jgi:hypothetical protein